MIDLQEQQESQTFLTEDPFPFLTDEGIFFLDNCVFELNYKEPLTHQGVLKGDKLSIPYCKENTSRLRLLTKKLANMGNWLTIGEVLQEYAYSIKNLKRLQEIVSFSGLSKAIGEWVLQQEKTYNEILSQKHIDANTNTTPALEDKIRQILPETEKIFKKFKGKTSGLNTDCKLISTALAFAEQEETSIFSQDLPLLLTFAYCAKNINLPLQPTYIINEAEQRKIMTQEFLESKKGFLKRILR